MYQTIHGVHRSPHDPSPKFPSAKEEINKRLQEVINLLEGRFLGPRDNTHQIDIFRFVPKARRQVKDSHCH